MKFVLTAKQYAERWQVDVETVYRWVAKGAVEVTRTPGGQLRFSEPAPGRAAIFIENPTKPDKDPQSST